MAFSDNGAFVIRNNDIIARRDIVVVGASAGGVDALVKLMSGLPQSFPAAMLVVMHIAPHATSNLHLILGRAGSLPVQPARDGAQIEHGHVYVATPDRHLLVEGNSLRTARGPKENRARPAVDALFRSAAFYFGPRVVGVILSGNLDDGTAGLWAIKDRGGVALVQSPKEAQFSSMPENAIQQVPVDGIWPAAELATAISSFVEEKIMIPEEPAAQESMAIETQVALGEDPLHAGSMRLGPISPNTCPQCHGSLVQIREGKIVRFRCHAGHAFSLQTLFGHVDEEIDYSLDVALRTVDERIILLRQMGELAEAANDIALAGRYARQLQESERWRQRLRQTAADFGVMGQDEHEQPAEQSAQLPTQSPGPAVGTSE